jgi:hypothetical protein
MRRDKNALLHKGKNDENGKCLRPTRKPLEALSIEEEMPKERFGVQKGGLELPNIPFSAGLDTASTGL